MSVTLESGEARRDFWVSDPEHGVSWYPHNGDGDHQHPSFGRAAVREFFASF